jgi:hypothetical protein
MSAGWRRRDGRAARPGGRAFRATAKRRACGDRTRRCRLAPHSFACRCFQNCATSSSFQELHQFDAGSHDRARMADPCGGTTIVVWHLQSTGPNRPGTRLNKPQRPKPCHHEVDVGPDPLTPSSRMRRAADSRPQGENQSGDAGGGAHNVPTHQASRSSLQFAGGPRARQVMASVLIGGLPNRVTRPVPNIVPTSNDMGPRNRTICAVMASGSRIGLEREERTIAAGCRALLEGGVHASAVEERRAEIERARQG